MKLYELFLPLAALALIAFAVRWQFHTTIDRATHADQSGAFPVSTPYTSPLCGVDNQDCTNLTFNTDLDIP